MNTLWRSESGNKNITLAQLIKELDRQKIKTKTVSLDKIKPLIIEQDYCGESKIRVNNANLTYPIIIVKHMGKYKSILDGNHRAFKALELKKRKIKARELNLDNKETPQIFRDLLGYEIKPLYEKH